MFTQKPVRVRCPHCHRVLSLTSALGGKIIACPNPACRKSVILPAPAAPANAIASAPRPVVTAPPAPNAETGARPQHHSRGRRWLIVAGVVGGVCLLGICVLVGSALFGSSTSTHQAVTSNAPPPTSTVADSLPSANLVQALTPGSPPSTLNAAGGNPNTSLLVGALTLLSAPPAAAPPIIRYVSREDPLLNVQAARLAVGRDGRVYLWSDKYVLRVNRDGTGKVGGEVTYALTAATANADGVIATGNGHFNHSVNLWSPKFERLGAVSDFLNNDKVQYFAPSDVQAGAGGDFYGLDENRNRILRVTAPGRLVTTYPLAGMGEDLTGKIARFRVWEGGKQFYVLCPSGTLRVLDFDGKPLWSVKGGVSERRGGFDVDEAGRLLVLEDSGDVVKVFDPDGAPAGELKLRMGERKGRVSDLRVFGDDVLVRRPDPVELFQVYDRKTGELRRVVRADVEKLTFTLSSEVWTAGDDIPVRIGVEAEGRTVRPAWRPWWRPLGGVEFRELPIRDSAVAVPTDAGGFYQLRVTPAGDGASDEYTVETVVEVRRPGAKGSASVFTPLNRVYYGQGERVPVSVLVRIAAGDALPDRVTVRLLDGDRVLAEGVVHPEAGKPSLLALPPSLTDALRPGEYLLTAEASGLTPAPQPLVIGPGLRRRPTFHIVQHGDFHDAFPKAEFFDAPEAVATHLARLRKLGVNLFVDRLGTPGTPAAVGQTLTPPGLAERAKADPRSPAPEKATFEGPIRRTVAAYGSFGIEEQAILLYMDAGLPVGTGFDARKPEQFADAITKVTTDLDGYPAFRGWSWAANWWIGKRGANAAATPEQKTAYEAALKCAKETGAWDLVPGSSIGRRAGSRRSRRATVPGGAAQGRAGQGQRHDRPLPGGRGGPAHHVPKRRRSGSALSVGADPAAAGDAAQRRFLQAARQTGVGPSGAVERRRDRGHDLSHGPADGDARGRRGRLVRQRPGLAGRSGRPALGRSWGALRLPKPGRPAQAIRPLAGHDRKRRPDGDRCFVANAAHRRLVEDRRLVL